MAEWKLRVRCPSKGAMAGKTLTLVFPEGGAATLADLRKQAASQAKVVQKKLRAKAGFPPTEVLHSPPCSAEGTTTLEAAGINNRDVITLEKEDAAESSATTAAAVAASKTTRGKAKRVQAGGAGAVNNGGLSSAEKSKPKLKARSRKQWGSGQTLGDGGTLAAVAGDGGGGGGGGGGAEPSPSAKRKAESELEGQAARAAAAAARAAVAAQDEEAQQIEEELYMSKKHGDQSLNAIFKNWALKLEERYKREQDEQANQPIEVGCTVRIHGLKSRTDLNGTTGVVHERKSDERWNVAVPGEAALLSLKYTCIERADGAAAAADATAGVDVATAVPAPAPAPEAASEAAAPTLVPDSILAGCTVRIHSLQSRLDLNGTTGVVQEQKGERWAVRLDSDGGYTVLSLKPSCLTPIAAAYLSSSAASGGGSGAAAAGASAAAGNAASAMQEAEGPEWQTELEMYLDIVANMLYAMKAEPEKSGGDFEPAWMRSVLMNEDIDVSDSSDLELEHTFDDIAEIYEEYEIGRLAEAFLETPAQQEAYDLSWTRKTLGYTSPTPADDDEEANNVWRELWETAKVLSAELANAPDHVAGAASAGAATVAAGGEGYAAAAAAHAAAAGDNVLGTPSKMKERMRRSEAYEDSGGASAIAFGGGSGAAAAAGAGDSDPSANNPAALLARMQNAGPSKRRRIMAEADARMGATQQIADRVQHHHDMTMNLPDVGDLGFHASENAQSRAEQTLGAGLVTAMSSASNNSVKKVFAFALKSREAEAEAEEKHKAVMGGNVAIALSESVDMRQQLHTHLTVSYTIGKKQRQEVVEHIPNLMLVGILHSIGSDPDAKTRDRLRPVEMVFASPRVYWNVVHQCGVGPGKEFIVALAELVPELDWDKLMERRRKLKYDSLEWCQ